jgi:hypothetical protein
VKRGESDGGGEIRYKERKAALALRKLEVKCGRKTYGRESKLWFLPRDNRQPGRMHEDTPKYGGGGKKEEPKRIA